MLFSSKKIWILLSAVSLLWVSCGGSSPTTPTNLPTTVEYSSTINYDAGDAIVTGSIIGMGASLGLIPSKDSDGTVVPEAVYAIDLEYNLTTATLISDRFFAPIAAGELYGIIFKIDSDTYVAYQDSTTGIHSAPLIFVDGAEVAGTHSVGYTETSSDISAKAVDASALTNSSIRIINLGSISITQSTAIGTSDENDLIEKLGYDPFDTALFDPSIFRFTTTARNRNNGSTGNVYDFFLSFNYESSEATSNVTSGFLDPSLLSRSGYSFTYYLNNQNIMAIYDKENACLFPPDTITSNDGVVYGASAPIQGLNDGSMLGSSSPASIPFYANMNTQDYLYTPSVPPEGTYSLGFTSSGTCPSSISALTNVETFPIYSPSSSIISGEPLQMPVISVKIVAEGGLMKEFHYKWLRSIDYYNSNGITCANPDTDPDWCIMTTNEVKKIVLSPPSGGAINYANASIYYNNSDTPEATSPLVFYFDLIDNNSGSDTAEGYVDISDEGASSREISQVSVSYIDIALYRYSFNY